MNSDGSQLLELTKEDFWTSYQGKEYGFQFHVEGFKWSQDGKQLACRYYASGENWGGGWVSMGVIDSDGENGTLFHQPEDVQGLDWSPDGKKIAVCKRNKEGKSGLFILNPDGSEETLIKECSCRYPDWSLVANE